MLEMKIKYKQVKIIHLWEKIQIYFVHVSTKYYITCNKTFMTKVTTFFYCQGSWMPKVKYPSDVANVSRKKKHIF